MEFLEDGGDGGQRGEEAADVAEQISQSGGGKGARSLARAPRANCDRPTDNRDDDFSTSSNFRRPLLPPIVPSPIALEEIELRREEGGGFDMAGIVRGKKWRPPGQENSKWRQQTEHGPASHTIAMGRVGQVTWKKQLLSHELTLQQQYPKHEHTVTPLHPGAAVVQATAYGLQRC